MKEKTDDVEWRQSPDPYGYGGGKQLFPFGPSDFKPSKQQRALIRIRGIDEAEAFEVTVDFKVPPSDEHHR